ncbi:MAG: hypothetical protein KDA89_03190, partial [Planctomycetaceae bacterium]|nr:hypothetical protein [Planctomycetaceae bacterium]
MKRRRNADHSRSVRQKADRRHVRDQTDSYPVPGTTASSSSVLQQKTSLAPDPTAPIPAVVVRNRISQTAVFRKQIERADNAKPGDLVAVYSRDQQLLGYGLYNPRSEMALRMLWRTAELPTDAAWNDLLQRATDLRQGLLRLNDVTDAWRVIHAEANGFPGLVVNRFGDILSAEAFSLGMYQRSAMLLERLGSMLGTQHSLIQVSPQFLSQEGFEPPAVMSSGCPAEVLIQEYGTRFKVRFSGGHKTGFFC